MVNLLRRFQQPLLIVVTIFTILAFVVLFNLPGTRNASYRPDTIATIYGHGVSRTLFDRLAKHFTITRDLGMMDLLRPLVGEARSLGEAENNVALNTLVLRHEAEQLGIMSANPSDSEQKGLDEQILARIKTMPQFQTNHAFDSTIYNMYVQRFLSPNGLTPHELEDVVADQIRLDKVKAVVGSTVGTTPAEVKDYYAERNGKLEVSVVRLKLDDFKAAAKVTDEDVKKLFEDRKATLKTPEKRKVKFAMWAPPKSDKPLTGSARGDMMQKLAEKAQDFAQAMTVKGADFAAEATKAGATTGETPAFESGKPPAELESNPKAAAAAFRLTTEQPNSDVLPTNNGMYVLQLAGTEGARPLTYEEAKPDLETQLKQDRGQEAMNLKAAEIRTKIYADLKAGKSVADAATAAGVKAEKLAPFSPSEPMKSEPDAMDILRQAMELREGQLSEFSPTATGGLLIHLDKKLPIDMAEYEQKKGDLEKELEESKREAVFREWLKARSQSAKADFARA